MVYDELQELSDTDGDGKLEVTGSATGLDIADLIGLTLAEFDTGTNIWTIDYDSNDLRIENSTQFDPSIVFKFDGDVNIVNDLNLTDGNIEKVDTIGGGGSVVQANDGMEMNSSGFGTGVSTTQNLSGSTGNFDGELRRDDGTNTGNSGQYCRWDSTSGAWVEISSQSLFT